MAEMIQRILYDNPLAYRWQQNSRRWIQVVVIGLVFLLAVAISFQFPPKRLPSVLLLILGAGGAYGMLRWPHLGLIALVPASLLLRRGVGTGTSTEINAGVMLLMVLTGLFAFNLITRQPHVRLVISRPMVPLLALVLVATLAFGIGQLRWFVYARWAPITAQVGGLALFYLSAAAFIIAASTLSELRWLKWFTGIFLAVGALFLLGSLVPGWGRLLVAMFSNGATGSLFRTWLVAVVVSQAVFNREMRPAWRIATILLAAVTLLYTMVFNRDWKSGWVPSLAAVGVILWFRWPKLTSALAIAGMFIYGNLPSQLIAEDRYSYITRVAAWEIILEHIVRVNPVLGLGPANYYYYTPLFPIMGYYVNFNSHNNYVDLIAQTGFLGLLCFLWFAWETGRLGWRLRKVVPAGFPQAYVIGCLGGLAGTLVSGMLGDWVIPFVYNVGIRGFRSSVIGWLFLGGLVACERLFKDAQRPA